MSTCLLNSRPKQILVIDGGSLDTSLSNLFPNLIYFIAVGNRSAFELNSSPITIISSAGADNSIGLLKLLKCEAGIAKMEDKSQIEIFAIF